MARRPGIFPTFFLSGFECSTFLWSGGQRRNLVEETLHREHAMQGYRILQQQGIAVAREGIPWPLADDGAYDFSRIDPMIAAMKETRITPIWDSGMGKGRPEWLHDVMQESMAVGTSAWTSMRMSTSCGAAVDSDPYSDPVELQDVIDAAKRLQPQPDAGWN